MNGRNEEHIAQLDKLFRPGSLEELTQALEKAVSIFDRKKDRENNRALAGSLSLLAISDYLEGQGIPGRLLQPLTCLINAQAAQLKGDSKTNKKPLYDTGLQAIAAVAVDILMDAGDTLETALRKVTKASGNQVSGSALRDFRKNVRSGRARTEAIEHYGKLLKKLRASPLKEPERSAWILDYVANCFRPSKKA